jgi:uncharacterized protein
MSIGDTLIVDAVAHAVDNSPEARNRNRYAASVVEGTFNWQEMLIPAEYVLEKERYFRSCSPEVLISSLFRESQVDVACFHAIPMWGIFKDYSPISVGLEVRRRYPHRMFIYGPLSPFEGPEKTIDELERVVSESHVDGIKMYPLDLIDGKLRSFSLADEKLLYPVLERCVKLGVKVLSIHKAVPLGIAPIDAYRVGDIDYAAVDFPQLAFEIVHAGLAFLDESALQMARYPNVYVNMEVTSQYGIKFREKFARIMGEFMLSGGADKLIFSTGCTFTHPRPVIEAFYNFKMPQHMLDGGYPEVTLEAKKNILGLNWAKMHGINLADLRAKIEADDIEVEKRRNGLRPAWTEARAA